MLLKESCIEKIYNDWKGKELDLDKMKNKYCINAYKYVYWQAEVSFDNGAQYYKEGLLTHDEYLKVINKFKNDTFYLSYINGKFCDETLELKDFKFYLVQSKDTQDTIKAIKRKIENYILENGKKTDYHFFKSHFQSFIDDIDSDNEKDNSNDILI